MYRAYQPETMVSCRGFISQYAYTQEDCIRVLEDKESGALLALSMDKENRLCACPPIGARSQAAFERGIERLRHFFSLAKEPALFSCVEERELKSFGALGGFRVESHYHPEEDDYVYATSRLKGYEGAENSQRRQSRSKFLRRHEISFKLNGEADRADCITVAEGWCALRDCAQCGYRCPYQVIRRVLGAAGEIGARVLLMYMDGIPEALVVTGAMGGGTEDLLAICSRTRTEGLTYALIERACFDAFPDAEYLNLEEDLGLPMLKHFKQLLRPVQMVHKYVVRLYEN